MGGGSSAGRRRQASTEVALEQVVANPERGLPNLLSALRYTPAADKQLLKLENDRGLVARILEVVLDAMRASTGDRSASSTKVAACAVIEHCIDLLDPTISDDQPSIGDYPKQCQQRLASWLVTAVDKARTTYVKDMVVDEKKSKECKAIALATVALFKIADHSAGCKQEMIKSGGTKAALSAFKLDSGISIKAQEALSNMLSCWTIAPKTQAPSTSISAVISSLSWFPHLGQHDKYKMKEPSLLVSDAHLKECPDHANKACWQSTLEKSRAFVRPQRRSSSRASIRVSLLSAAEQRPKHGPNV